MKHRHAKYDTENVSVCLLHTALNRLNGNNLIWILSSLVPPLPYISFLLPRLNHLSTTVPRRPEYNRCSTKMFTVPRYSLRPRHWTKAAPQATWRRSRRCWWACTQRSPVVWRCRWHEVDFCAAATTPCTDDGKQSEPQMDAACMENGGSTRWVKTSNIPTEVPLRLNTMLKIGKGSAFNTFVCRPYLYLSLFQIQTD